MNKITWVHLVTSMWQFIVVNGPVIFDHFLRFVVFFTENFKWTREIAEYNYGLCFGKSYYSSTCIVLNKKLKS